MRTILAIGCFLAATLAAPAQVVPAGASADAVLRALGPPRSRSAARDREIWLYPEFQVIFQQGRVTGLVSLPADGGNVEWRRTPPPGPGAEVVNAAGARGPVLVSRDDGRTTLRSPDRRPAPPPRRNGWLIAGLAAAAASGAWILWWRRRRRDAPAVPAPVPPPRTVPPPVPPQPETKPPSLTEWELPLDLLRSLVPARFEQLVERYHAVQGLRVKRNAAGVDGGADLRLYRGRAPRPFCQVKCSGWGEPLVGDREVRQLFEAMAADRIPEGAWLTSGDFTPEARAFAERNRIALLSGPDLVARFNRLSPLDRSRILREVTRGDYTTPLCPRCGVPLVREATRREPVWACRRYSTCHYKVSPAAGGLLGAAR